MRRWRAALLAEAVAVPVHPQQRGRGVGAQRVQPEPGVGHPGVEPDRGAELLLGLGVGAHRVGVHGPQPGEIGRGARVPCAEVHQVPTSRAPGAARRTPLQRDYAKRELVPGIALPSGAAHPLASYPRRSGEP